MSVLARYKKGSGIIELVKLIESSAEPKRSQLMNMVRNEDPDFAVQVEARVFTFEKLKAMSENVVAEIISVSPVKFIALAIFGEDEAFRKLVIKCLGNKFSEYKSETEAFETTPPSPAQVESARRKLVSEARKLEASGAIKLNSTTAEAPSQPSAGADLSTLANESEGAAPLGDPGSSDAVGVATVEDGCPSIDSFKLEAPPPGLSGERLETFIKQTLGIK